MEGIGGLGGDWGIWDIDEDSPVPSNPLPTSFLQKSLMLDQGEGIGDEAEKLMLDFGTSRVSQS